MYLTRMILSPMCRDVRRLVPDFYEVHKFASQCLPATTSEGGERLLWRLETDPGTGALTLLVQTKSCPAWDFLGKRDYRGYLARLNSPNPEIRQVNFQFAPGQMRAFSLVANPTTSANHVFNLPVAPIRDREAQEAWLARQGSGSGFELIGVRIAGSETVKADQVKEENGKTVTRRLTFVRVSMAGHIRITDPRRMVETIERGIGRGKGFGFGLLAVRLLTSEVVVQPWRIPEAA